MDSLTLGTYIRERRKELGMTQRDLAHRVDVSPAYLSQIETGIKKWPQKYVGRIAEALGVTETDLAMAAGLITTESFPSAKVRMDAWLASASKEEIDAFRAIRLALALASRQPTIHFPPGERLELDLSTEEIAARLDALQRDSGINIEIEPVDGSGFQIAFPGGGEAVDSAFLMLAEVMGIALGETDVEP